MDLTPGQKKLLPYWGNIQQAVSLRASTADLWTAVRDAATREGVALTGVSAADMSVLRGLAGGQRNALETFGQSRTDAAITARMIATDISARPVQDQLLAPRWIVRFQHDVTVDGELQTFWRSSIFEGSLPATTGDLRSAVESDAVALADDYGTTHAGVGAIQISAV